MKKTLVLFTLLIQSFSFASEADLLDWNQWALNNSGQTHYKDSGKIFVSEIEGKAHMDIGMPSNSVMEELAKIDREVVVAVIDRGIDMHHPKFKGRLYEGKDFLSGAEMKDDNGHGTHVAGIIAANVEGGGIRGVTPKNVKILPLKVLSDQIEGFIYTRKTSKGSQKILITDIIADAINYAADANVDVINLSLGWPKSVHTPRVIKALNNAAAKGIVIVAASGNNNKNVPLWPCSHTAVICVGAMNNQGEISELSNHGGKVDLITSGEWIVSTIPRDIESRRLRIQGQDAKNGSSQAAPFVSAAAALIKLKYPKITSNEIKAALFKSASKVTTTKDGASSRFVRYGRLNLASALKMGPTSLTNLNVKDLVTVSVNSSQEYSFTLPIERLGKDSSQVSIEVEGLPGVNITQSETSVNFNGRINDLTQDSEKDIVLIVKTGDEELRTLHTLSFATKAANKMLPPSMISTYPANRLLKINGDQKAHALGVVSVEDKIENDFISYTTKTNRKNKTIETFIFTANANDDDVEIKKFTLKDHSQFLAVFKKDINLDGNVDYMFYGKSSDSTELILSIFDNNGNPLFSNNSSWRLPITHFAGLPLIETEKSDFSWIKIDSFLGEIVVPYFKKNWMMPEEDNGSDLLDFETGRKNHFFYLLPELKAGKVIITPRVYDSVNLVDQITNQVHLEVGEKIEIENIIPQTLKESLSGQVRHMVSIGEDFYRRYYILTANKVGHLSLKQHGNQDPFQVQNMFLKSFDYTSNNITKDTFQFALLDRSKARVGEFTEDGSSNAWALKTSGWSDPFFQVIGAFQGEQKKTLFFESRYHVYVYEKNGSNSDISVSKLPINRDSSFPGVKFSETLKTALIKTGSENSAGIAIDSTLIYGDRLYSMVKTDDDFKRPISLSVQVPRNCISLQSRFLKKSLNVSAYVLLCKEANNTSSIKFIPLEM